jgi:hypothetical protein
MDLKPPQAAQDIDKIARNILIASKTWGKFPTPVDEIIRFTELQIDQGVDLSSINPGFLTSQFHFLSRALKKVVGLVDIRQNTIYLDHSQKTPRKNFIKLHEVGHHALSWQNEMLGYMDDDSTLDPSVKDEFEREASYFASGTLFQLDRFDDEASKLPLCISSPQVLGKKFGGSNHAAIRRYVERCKKRCAVLILHKPETSGVYAAKIRDYFQSISFTADFGEITWPEIGCGLLLPFVRDIQRKRRFHEDGQVALLTPLDGWITFTYHFFDSSYNVFVFLMPVGEKIKSRTVIIPR